MRNDKIGKQGQVEYRGVVSSFRIKSIPSAPEGNPSRLADARLLFDPTDDFLVCCTSSDELFEFS